MASQRNDNRWLSIAALAIAVLVSSAAAQGPAAPKPAPGKDAGAQKPGAGGIKGILDRAGQIPKAAAAKDAAIGEALKPTPGAGAGAGTGPVTAPAQAVPAKGQAPAAGSKAPAAAPRAPAAAPKAPAAASKAPAAAPKEVPAAVSKAGSKVAAGGQKAPASPKQPEKRDPFVSPLKTMAPATIQAKRPPGKAGMLIGQANLLGVARTPSGMQAIVVAENQTFFLKENDKVFNGRVLKIASDSLVFEETVVDPMGQTVKREVVKKLPVEVK